jgi:hypothetical protein
VAGPSGSGKTAWISKALQEHKENRLYLCPGPGEMSVDVIRIGYCYPEVRVLLDDQIPPLAGLSEDTVIFLELGFQLDLQIPFLATAPCQRIAVLPPDLPQSPWHEWADEIISGNGISPPDPVNLPQLWCSALNGQVFDAPSLDELLIEITEGAYGTVHRLKGVFELPDGRAFYVDFVQGLEGLEYQELPIPRWLNGRPRRPSAIEVVGWQLDQATIVQTLLDSCLPEAAIDHYQQQYASLAPAEEPATP